MFKDFVANLFGKLYTKFYQNRPIFYRKYYKKKHLGLFFPAHIVNGLVTMSLLVFSNNEFITGPLSTQSLNGHLPLSVLFFCTVI